MLACALLSGMLVVPARAADRQTLQNIAPAAVANATPLRHSPRWNKLNLAISLPLRDRPGLTNLLQQLYDPASAGFRHYLTPEQFAAAAQGEISLREAIPVAQGIRKVRVIVLDAALGAVGSVTIPMQQASR